ncbi:MAG: hypothetical protein ACKOF9_02665 [Burkholderiales bacterium]
MNDRAAKTAYKNNIHIETIDVDSDDDLDTTDTSTTTGKGLGSKSKKHKKTKALSASTSANRNERQQDSTHTTASHAVPLRSAKVQPLLRTLDKAMVDAPATPEQRSGAVSLNSQPPIDK